MLSHLGIDLGLVDANLGVYPPDISTLHYLS